MGLDMFTRSYEQGHHPVPHFHRPQQEARFIQSFPHCPSPQPPAATTPAHLACALACSGPSCLPALVSRFTHVGAGVGVLFPFCGRIIVCCVDGPRFISSWREGHAGCFHLLVTGNDGAMRLTDKLSWERVFSCLDYIPFLGMNLCLAFRGTNQTVFHSRCTISCFVYDGQGFQFVHILPNSF